MNYLTIDVSAGISVGLVHEETSILTTLAQETTADTRHHAETLSPMIAKVLDGKQPDAIIAGTGPAAFTGLRAGLVTARTLARAWDVPIYGLSSLEILALAACDAGANIVVPMIDARRKEVFALRARAMGADDVEILAPARVVKPALLAEKLAAAPAVLAATDASLYVDVLGKRQVVEFDPQVMVRLLLSRQSRHEAGEEISLDTEPQYLRRPDIHGQPA